MLCVCDCSAQRPHFNASRGQASPSWKRIGSCVYCFQNSGVRRYTVYALRCGHRVESALAPRTDFQKLRLFFPNKALPKTKHTQTKSKWQPKAAKMIDPDLSNESARSRGTEWKPMQTTKQTNGHSERTWKGSTRLTLRMQLGCGAEAATGTGWECPGLWPNSGVRAGLALGLDCDGAMGPGSGHGRPVYHRPTKVGRRWVGICCNQNL